MCLRKACGATHSTEHGKDWLEGRSSEPFFSSIKGGWVDLKDVRCVVNRPGVRQHFPDVLVLDFLEADPTAKTEFGGDLSDIT